MTVSRVLKVYNQFQTRSMFMCRWVLSHNVLTAVKYLHFHSVENFILGIQNSLSFLILHHLCSLLVFIHQFTLSVGYLRLGL